MKIKYRVFLLMFFFVALFAGTYSYLGYVEHRDMGIKEIDEKLYAAAIMARATLPEDYHDRIVDSTSVSRNEFDKIVDRFNKLCVTLDMEYLWSLMEVNGKIVFTTSTSPDKDVSNQKHARYFEAHSNPELYHKVFSTQEPQYQINIDKWGKIKVVLVPFLDSHGRPYMFGASMKLTEVDAMLDRHINESLLLGLGLLFIGLLFSFFLANLLSKPFNKLMIETSEIAAGQLDKQVEEKGFYEQAALARSFNRMSRSIKEKHEELEWKNKELEQVVYVTSHDLRSPLLNVEGYSGEIGDFLKDIISLLDNEGVPPEIKERLAPIIKDSRKSIGYIREGVSKMNSLLNGLLEFSRMGRVEINKEELDMNRLMSGVLSGFKFRVRESGAKTEISDLPSCTGDEVQINQVFSNLISNAFRYSDPDRPCIVKISGRKENDRSVYCVEDNGRGIAPEYQKKIFEIFYQLNPEEGGEGLGLSIVHKIVERHNGRIWVESESGKGSRFYISL